MYYIMADNLIVDERYYRPTDEQLQEWANDFDCELWVLQGEHFGMTARPIEPDKDEGDKDKK